MLGGLYWTCSVRGVGTSWKRSDRLAKMTMRRIIISVSSLNIITSVSSLVILLYYTISFFILCSFQFLHCIFMSAFSVYCIIFFWFYIFCIFWLHNFYIFLLFHFMLRCFILFIYLYYIIFLYIIFISMLYQIMKYVIKSVPYTHILMILTDLQFSSW